jgi:hypothetical protein
MPRRARGAVHQPQRLGGGRGVVGQPAQGGLQQVGGTAQTPVVFGLGQQPGEQVPDPGRRGAQPVVFVVVAQQHLGDRQADQFGVGHGGRAARADAAPWPQGGNDPVGHLDVQCDKKSVQVGDHGRPLGSKVCEHADLGHSSPFPHPSPTNPPIRINDLVVVADDQVLIRAGFRLLVDFTADRAWDLWSITHQASRGRRRRGRTSVEDRRVASGWTRGCRLWVDVAVARWR